MKKILSLLLALIMCLTVLTSCDVQGTIEQVKGTVTGVVEQIKDKIDSIINPEEPVEYHIDKAESFLKNMYKDVNPVTGADYEVVGQVRVAGVAYTVTWESNSEQVVIVALENGNYLVDLNEKATEDVPYVLTATITAGNGDTATVTYNRTIPQYNVLSWDAYMAAQKGDVVLVEGIVVEMNAKSLGNSRNHLFLMDASGKGGYYVYQMDQDPAEAGVKIGMTVSVSGPIEPYSGMQEIKGGTFTIVDETIKEVAPIDITDLVVAGTVNYGEYVALPVTIKGVTIGSQDMTKDSSQYLYFTLPDAKGTQAYVRTYVTDFPTTLSKAPTAENADKAAIDKLHADHFGYTADVTGILILYSGNPYLIPMSVDCFTNFSYVEKTAEEKVDAELGELALETTVTSSTVVDILTVGKYYEDVTISWTSDSEYAVIEGNKLTLTVPTTGATAKVTATVTCGDVTKTKEFTIKLSMEPTALADIITLALSGEHNVYTTDKYIVAGVITEVYNTTYGNMKITDEFGNILTIYGTYGADGALRYDALESKPVAGDYVVVLGVVGHYNGTAQVKNGWILTFTTPTSIEDANAIGAAKEHNTYTEEKHLITGVVTEVANTKYGNLYIEDEAGNKIYVYGCYDQAGNRYDAMVEAGHAPVVGDTITVLSIVGQYNGTVQLKNATVVVRVAGATEEPAHECEHVCETCQKCTDAACEESVCAEKCEGHETTEEPEVSNTVELTVNSLGLADQSYSAGTATVGGVAFEFVQLGNYGDGIQMRDKDGKTSILWNTSAFGSAIVRIDLVYSSTKDVTHSNPDAVIFSFGTAVDNLTYSTKLSTTAGTKTYTITPDAESYTFFKLEHDLGYSMYWESITFVLADGTTVNPNPNPNPDPVHTCESKCEECGKCTDAACTESVCAEKCEGHNEPVDPPVDGVFSLDLVPAYDASFGGYYIMNNNTPYFTAEDIAKGKAGCFEEYTARDNLGRAIMAFACVCNNTLPTDSRGDISSVKPTGWVQKSYDNVPGGSLYNRSHLIAWSLTDEDANWENLVTGTEHMNQKVMTQFENIVRDYVKASGSNKVLYRVTPIYNGNNLVCTGILMEAYSINDNGEDIEFCVFVYNVQPGISINYANGQSQKGDEAGQNSGLAGSADSGNQGGGSSVVPVPVGQYTLSANNADGVMYFKGTVTSGRFDCSTNAADAVVITVSTVEGGYVLSFQMGGATQYIVMEDSSTGGKFTTKAEEATVFEWNASLNTYVVAEDSNSRAFGAGVSSTYKNLSPYDASSATNAGKYNWGVFTPVGDSSNPGEGGTTTPSHTCESECDECGKCLDADCDDEACADKCQGHSNTGSGSTDETTYTFVLNTSSKKIHDPNCGSVSTMSEKNKKEWTGTYAELQELLNSGYKACGNCKPGVE